MKLALLLAVALVACALAAPASNNPDAVPQIVRSEFEQQPEGGYSLNFEVDNGISRQEIGELKEVLNEDNKPQQVVVVRGSYTFLNDEGKPLTITYTADENGYVAEGDSIPK